MQYRLISHKNKECSLHLDLDHSPNPTFIPMAYTSYNTIGTGYDATRKADPYLSERVFALLGLPGSGHMLDVGCGTGNYTVELAKKGLRMTGMDPSRTMLDQAQQKSAEIIWNSGTAENIPFADGTFNGAISTLTTHHWNDPEKGFGEIHRVLVIGSKLVLFTSTPEQMRGYWLCHYFPKTMERSCNVMPTLEATLEGLHKAGFVRIVQEPYSIRVDHQDHFLYSAKDQPERYLYPEFRKGISTFSALSDPEELADGLARLERDIASGAWSHVRARYTHDRGDYLFITAQR